MIKVEKLVPSVYYNRSRDFQVLGRTYEVVFNYLKTNTDLINNLPISDDIDDQLLDLLCTTLGFKLIHSYKSNALRGLCSIFCYIIKNKGNKKAIKTVTDMLLNIEGITGESTVEIKTNDDNGTEEDYPKVNIYVPNELTSITLLYDILEYVVPAGVRVEIRKTSVFGLEPLNTNVSASKDDTIQKGLTNGSNESADVLATDTAIIPQYIEDLNVNDAAAGTNDTMTIPQFYKENS